MKELVWNVIYHNINGQRIETFNVFKHGGFIADIEKDLKRCSSKEEFAEPLRRSLFYYFGSKTEWEIIISPWVGSSEPCDIKIDVFDQVMMNFDIFVDYVWDNRKELLKLGDEL
jgi:hypothetical protein